MNYTILLITALCVIATNASPAPFKLPTQLVQKVKRVGNQCIKETGAPADSLTNTIPWNLAENEINNKFLFCLCKENNLINDQGDFNSEKVMNVFSNSDKKDDIAKVFTECNALKAKDKYDTVYKITDCFFGKAPISLSL
ncbi:PREDICTED: uncharacterized protein LOC106100315 [Papilio polytes]|uniref:uncharacterized protein LOC106100315 n=1 Tax=Papilio polytes TaxID=76194 RepID=UPI0006769190|nr:PREDICTED: uncharacterized protein LOC106100315 [Papilio polytes]